MGFDEREARFYRELAAGTPYPTPTCYFADIDATEGHSLILMEDLAPGRNGSWVAGSSVQELYLAVTEIAKTPRSLVAVTDPGREDLVEHDRVMSASQVQPIFDQTWPSFLEKLLVPASGRSMRWANSCTDT